MHRTTNPCQGAIAEAFLTMLDEADVDAVIYPVHDSSAPYIGQWTYGQPFGALLGRAVVVCVRLVTALHVTWAH